MKDTYYGILKKQVEDLGPGTYAIGKSVLYLPDIFYLMSNLLDQDMVTQEDRLLINSAVSYLVVPCDVLPEEVYGAAGLMDDLYICSMVMTKMYPKYRSLINSLWNNSLDDEPFEKILDLCFVKSGEIVEQENIKDKILRYAGLIL